MKKALVTADLHLDIYNRFEDKAIALNNITHVAREEGVDEVWILGDVYERKRPYNAERGLFHSWIGDIMDFAKVKILSGNHDMDQFNVSALYEFEILSLDNAELISNPSIVTLGKFNIYLGHFLINGAKLGNDDYTARDGKSIEKIIAENKADLYLFGDVHKAQKMS
jgi:predicted phosphodiesterase